MGLSHKLMELNSNTFHESCKKSHHPSGTWTTRPQNPLRSVVSSPFYFQTLRFVVLWAGSRGHFILGPFSNKMSCLLETPTGHGVASLEPKEVNIWWSRSHWVVIQSNGFSSFGGCPAQLFIDCLISDSITVHKGECRRKLNEFQTWCPSRRLTALSQWKKFVQSSRFVDFTLN